MESIFPVSHPTEKCFEMATAAYLKEFGTNPPGNGTSEARYQAIILALEVGAPATEQDIKDFELPPQ